MRLAKTLQCVFQEPWLIQSKYHANIRRLVDMKLSMPAKEFSMREREGEDFSGEKVKLDSMVIDKGIAHIPFAGVLVKGASGFDKYAGALSHDDIMVDVNEAIEDPLVKGLFFDVDSPGGTAAGSFELSDTIAAAQELKPCMAWVEGLCCSAAFLSVSGCGMIYGSRTSEIGAVECYMAWIDSSARFDEMGLKMEIIKNTGGDYVATGFPGTSLTDDQRGQLQQQVDQLFMMYVDHIEEVRPQVERGSMRGQTFIGTRGVESGMMDAITTKEQAVKDLRQWAGII